MVARPALAAVDVGAWVDFECAVIGNLIESVKWTRDFGKIRKDKNFFVTKVKYGVTESKGFRLTLGKVRLEDSGFYQCTASNRFQSITKTVKLTVWPPGGRFLTSDAGDPFCKAHRTPDTLDITEEEIKREYFLFRDAPVVKKKKTKKRKKYNLNVVALASSVTTVVVVVAAVVCAGVCLACYRMRLQKKASAKRAKKKRKRKKSEGRDSLNYTTPQDVLES